MMASSNNELGIARLLLSDQVSADGLKSLLEVVGTYYEVNTWLSHVEAETESRSREGRERTFLAPPLRIEYLTIGTPNEVQLVGPIAQVTAIVALAAAVIALPKLPLEQEQIRVSIENTRADIRLKQAQAVGAEVDALERARRLHSDGKLTDAELSSVTLRLAKARPHMQEAAGVLRDGPSLERAGRLQLDRARSKLLDRIALLGASTPTANLFRGVFAGDAAVVKAALSAGADPNAGFYTVLKALPNTVTEDKEFERLFIEVVQLERAGE